MREKRKIKNVARKVNCERHIPKPACLSNLFGQAARVLKSATYRQRLAYAAAAGVLLTLAFPRFNLSAFAWVVPGLWLLTSAGVSPREAFKIGYAGGLAHYLSSLHWLLHLPFPQTAWLGWLALSGYCALYPATWIWLCWKLAPTSRVTFDAKIPAAHYPCLDSLFAAGWCQRQLWLLLCAAAWAALELTRGQFLTGFPWNFLGVSHHQILPLVQIASVTGVLGLSFLLVWFSVGLLCAVTSIIRRPTERWAWLGETFCPITALMLVVGWGFLEVSRKESDVRYLRVALVQPSIPQKIKFNPEENAKAFQRVLNLSEVALATKPDLLIWPEAVAPGFLRYDEKLLATVTNLARTNNVWILLGADDAERRKDDSQEANYFNSAFLVSPEGKLAGKYDKRHLVIFGEYVPLAKWLPFLKWLTPIGEGFTPGTVPARFNLLHGAHRTRLTTLICFEDLLPHLARESAANADILVNLTNDGWFGESAQQWQHAANAAFRAVETGRPLVRCTNNGLTCWVDTRGRFHETHFGDSPDIYGAGFKTVLIPIGSPIETFYQRYGDWFGWSCAAVTLLAWLLAERSKKGWASAAGRP